MGEGRGKVPLNGSDPRRALPSVESVLAAPDLVELAARHGRGPVTQAVRDRLAALRAGPPEALPGAVADLATHVAATLAPRLRTVINATGIVVHTNLGRAILPASVGVRLAEVATSAVDLEMDLATGQRGQREHHLERRLRSLLGVEASAVVNNNAAAVLLAVNTLAEGREVIVSRGELVEIGGSFRIPDVIRKAGARLREVGTTNRTRVADYRDALTSDTALLLKVHPSNFRVVGFTESVPASELAGLARERGVPLLEDQGSGLVDEVLGLPGEPTVRESVAAGVDLVAFSGDKLLGGPQAGVIAGRATLVGQVLRNPLYRALRVDKLTIAALEAVLVEHEAGRAADTLPVLRMLSGPMGELRARAHALARELDVPGLELRMEDGEGAVGGGAAPGVPLPSVVVVLRPLSVAASELARRLRLGDPAVVASVAHDAVRIDVRTVLPSQDAALALAVRAAASR